MNPNHLKWIAGAVVALLLVWLGARLLPKGTDRLAGTFRLTAVPPDSADTVTFTGSGDPVVLIKTEPGRWTVNGFPAAPAAVLEFFGGLKDSVPHELVARSTGSFARLGVDSANARRVRIVQGSRTALDLFLSERGPEYASAYVRAPGDSAVYALMGGLGGMVHRRLDDWRNRTIASVATDSVHEVDLQRGARRIVLRRVAGKWQLARGGATDSTAMHALLEHFRTITASGFPSTAQLDSAFHGPVDRRATLRGAVGTMVALEFDSTVGGFWVRRTGSGREDVYRLNTWDADQLFPADSTLIAKPKPQ